MSQLPDRWQVKRLDELCEIARGGSPRPIKQFLTDSPDGVNWIKIGDATASTKYIYETKEKIKPEGISRSRLVKEGDFLLSNSMSFGRPYIMKTTGCIHDGWLVLSDKSGQFNQDYLYYFLGSPAAYSQFDILAAGSTVRNLNIDLVKSVNVMLPPLPEQKRIVAILDEAFAGISQAVTTAEKNLANARELFESYLNGVFTRKGEGWVDKKLGDEDLLKIIDGDRGKNYPNKIDFMSDGYCLFLNTKNVRPDGFNFDNKMFISKDKDEALRKGKLQRRDVILTTRGTIGNIAIYNDSVEYESIRINSGMLILRPNETVLTSDFLFEILRSSIFKGQINQFVSGAAQPQLPINTLINFTIPVPNKIEDQKQMVSQLRELFQHTVYLEKLYQQKLTSLTELKHSMLQKAFSGELTSKPKKVAV